jgi:ankyrin repeat protein
MAEYKYKPIDLDRPGVRLLRLFRGNFTDNIQCDLFEGWINQTEDGIPYDALSYTWGSTEKVAQITVNGSTMHVTSNLHAALQHLRFEEEDRLLWIDAICIDQDNMAERRHQVQHISYIYKEAERVVIWLGEGTQESDFLMDSIKQLQENNVKVEGDWRRSAQLWMRPRTGLGGINTHQNDKWTEGMELMLRRPWFQRIWILQEIANARVATIHCGKKSVSARTFAQVPSIIGLQPKPHTQAVLDIMPGLSRKESWWGQKRNLHTLLVKFRESKATDKRDIIYALLGISLDVCQSNILLPDYTKSLQQVIRDTTSFLLSHTDQDQSLYNFLHWTLPEFLQSLDSLSSAVLGSASEDGQEAMVELLLATNKVELDWKDKGDQTPLHQAARNGHEAIVRLLLATGQVEVNAIDNSDQTALLCAAGNGHEAVIKLLLETGKVEVDAIDRFGRTPLLWAAGNGHKAVVKLLLETSKVEVDAMDNSDQTALLWAARNGHKAVVKLLLETCKVEVNAMDNSDQTALSWATNNRHKAVVKLLLETSKVEVDAMDNSD